MKGCCLAPEIPLVEGGHLSLEKTHVKGEYLSPEIPLVKGGHLTRNTTWSLTCSTVSKQNKKQGQERKKKRKVMCETGIPATVVKH